VPKQIPVHISTGRAARPVIDASISLAAKFEAHLDALAVGYISPSTAAYAADPTGGAAVAAVFEVEQDRAAQCARAALGIFETEAHHAGTKLATHATPSKKYPPMRRQRSALSRDSMT
jgi:hypothetical protein